MTTTATTSVRDLLRLTPGAPVDLTEIDPRATPGLPAAAAASGDRKAWSKARIAETGSELAGYQERLFAAAKRGRDSRRLLVVLQAMDAGGKDGTVSHVVGAFDPLGLCIVSFGVPTAQERRHDFLWRIRRALPEPGYIGIFNRSHYEDVLVTRVNGLIDEDTWRARYAEINAFERELVDDGTVLVKIMLHISPEEQHRRLLARLSDPTKYWKYEPGDVDDRARWGDYQAAYADALRECGTPGAPWHVVPADRKWYRNWAVAELLRETLAEMDPQYPPAHFDVDTERARLGG